MSRPFSAVDKQPDIHQAEALAYLDGVARSPMIRETRARARENWRLRAPRRLLDAGAGSGDLARGFAALTGPDGEVVALDASQAMLDAAQTRADGSPVRYVKGDVQSLPYADGYFDGVWCERVLQHLDDPDVAIAEMARVMRPGGRICLIDTDWASRLLDGSPAELADLFGPMTAFLDASPWMGRTLRRRLLSAGMTGVETVPVTVAMTSHVEASTLLTVFSREKLNTIAPPGVDKATAEKWLDLVDEAVADGTFLFALTIWVATATKR